MKIFGIKASNDLDFDEEVMKFFADEKNVQYRSIFDTNAFVKSDNIFFEPQIIYPELLGDIETSDTIVFSYHFDTRIIGIIARTYSLDNKRVFLFTNKKDNNDDMSRLTIMKDEKMKLLTNVGSEEFIDDREKNTNICSGKKTEDKWFFTVYQDESHIGYFYKMAKYNMDVALPNQKIYTEENHYSKETKCLCTYLDLLHFIQKRFHDMCHEVKDKRVQPSIYLYDFSVPLYALFLGMVCHKFNSCIESDKFNFIDLTSIVSNVAAKYR